jgi:hypothetical protein
MPFVPIVGSIAEITAKGVYAAAGSSAKNIVSVFHYRLALLAAAPTKTALETIFQTTVCIPMTAAMNSRYTQQENRVRWINDATDPGVSFARAVPGAVATDSMPCDDCVSLLYRTGLRGRAYRGSKHFAGVNEIDTTGDVLTGAGLIRWQALQTGLFTTLVDALGNSWIPSVLSRSKSVLATNPTTVVANDVTQVLLNKNVGIMRKRRVATVR